MSDNSKLPEFYDLVQDYSAAPSYEVEKAMEEVYAPVWNLGRICQSLGLTIGDLEKLAKEKRRSK